MANKFKGERDFTVGEGEEQRTYHMVLDANAFCEIEEVLGLNLPELVDALQRRPSLRLFRAILYGALHEHHPELTLADCGNLLSEMGLERVTQEVSELTQNVMPTAKAPVGNVQPPAAIRRKKAGAGKGSSRSGSKPPAAGARIASGG